MAAKIFGAKKKSFYATTHFANLNKGVSDIYYADDQENQNKGNFYFKHEVTLFSHGDQTGKA